MRGRKVFDLDLARRHRSVACDAVALDRHIRRADLMAELFLASVLLEEPIEVRVAGAEAGSVVRSPE